MRQRELGRTTIRVSEVGFGTWGLGGVAYGPIDEATALATLRCAIEHGITFFDTSDFYGRGRSERLLGHATRGRRDQVVIATKGGMLPHSGFEMPQDFRPGALQLALEQSLRRLQTDYVDVYQLHSPPLADVLANPEIVGMLERQKEAGKLRAWGISVRSPSDGAAAIEHLNTPVIEVNLNLADQRAMESGLLDLAADKGVGVIARTPLAFGYLSGALTGAERLDASDHRAKWPQAQLQAWAQASDHFSMLGQALGLSSAALALRFCTSSPSVSTVIPGMMTSDQVLDNARQGSSPKLSGRALAEIRTIYRAHNYYDPSVKRGSQEASRCEPTLPTAPRPEHPGLPIGERP